MGKGFTAGRAGRIVAGVVLGAVVAGGVGYGVLLLVNRNDQAPSADARRLQQLVDARPIVADHDNAYVYLLGIDAAQGVDPVALGVQRKAYIEDYPVRSGGGDVPPWPGGTRPGKRGGAEAAINQACREDGLPCAQLLEREPALLPAWLSASMAERDRYQGLIARPQWRESIPASLFAPLPAWAPALEGQRLWLLSAWQQARDGDGAGAVAALQQDLAFWRVVLRDSDLLITKMVAAAAIRHHFAIGNLVLQQAQRHGGPVDVPAAWRQPFDARERSLLRALAGEWRYAAAGITLAAQAPEAQADGVLEGAIARLGQPLLLPQASLNEYASRLLRLAEASTAPYPQLQQALDAAARPPAPAWYRKLYNPGGRVLLGTPGFPDYAVRVADLEGLRRVALLAAQLRALPPGAPLAEQIAGTALRDPYEQAPFGWDQAGRSLSFVARRQGAGATRMPL